MKYVLLFVETEEFADEMAALGASERERAHARVNEWFASHADKLRGGSRLKSPDTATTVRLDRGDLDLEVAADDLFTLDERPVDDHRVAAVESHRRRGVR